MRHQSTAELLETYIPIDRRLALARGADLPDRTFGAALFADISGFTPLTEALVHALGPQRGAEELPRQLNLIYDALIAEVDRYGGSVVFFSGDAITCWFDESVVSGPLAVAPPQISDLTNDNPRQGDKRQGDKRQETRDRRQESSQGTRDKGQGTRDKGQSSTLRATACALAIQTTMAQFAAIAIPGAGTVAMAIKVAVASGPVRRLIAGDAAIQLIDVLVGATLDRLAEAEHYAGKGEVVVDEQAAAQLGDRAIVEEWRVDAATEQRFAAVSGLAVEVAPAPWPQVPPGALHEDQTRPWLLPPVYERLHSGQGEFLTELRPVVVLFLRFGGIDYDQDSQAGTKLDAYLRWVQGILAHYGGFMLQLTIGDKGSYLYAAFGAPLAHEDDAARAAAAALELRAPPDELEFVQDIQIGISQGQLRTGAYGGATRRTYGVLGDAVNLAARLMQNAPPGQALVSSAAQRPTADAFLWERLPPLLVKGKSEPVALFRLIAANQRRVARLQEPRYALPMVGRTAELALVEQQLAHVLRGRGQVIAITAEAGMGKSRLIAEIVRLANARQLAGFVGECQSYGTNNSYLVWESIWRAFFAVDTTDSLDEQLGILGGQLVSVDPMLLPRLPLLRVALNLPLPDNHLTRSLDAKLRKASLEALLVDCVRARAHARPHLFVLEDCHWIDPVSHDLIEAIGRAIADLPVLMIVAYRPPGHERVQAPRVTLLPNSTIIGLTDFTVEEARQLIEFKLVQFGDLGVELPPGLVEQIVERAQGNPFYIEELLNYLRDQGLDAQALARLELPSSLHSLILSRIDQLTESQKSTLKIASVIGRLFPAAMLWGAYPQLGEPEQIRADLDTMSRLDLTPLDTPEPELTYLFRHVLTREAAYESLSFATRALLHDQIGQFIERTYSATLDQHIDLLAYHFDHSRNEAKRREYLRRAGLAAQAAYANDAAIDYYQRLLPLLPEAEQPPTTLNLGQVFELVGQWGEAGTLYQQTLSLAEQLGDRHIQAQGQRALGWLLRKQGEYTAALDWLNQARAAFEQLGDEAGAIQALADLGEVYRLQGAYQEADRCYTESLELAGTALQSNSLLAARANALKGAGTLANQQGDPTRARALYEESLAIRRELGDKPGVAALLNNLGMVALYQGDYPTAGPLYEESLTLLQELGDRWASGLVLNNLALVTRYLGDDMHARSLLEESLTILRQLGDKWGVANSLSSLGDLAIDQGDYTSADDFLTESLSLNQELGDRTGTAYALEYFSGLATVYGKPARALCLAGAAATLREAIGAPLPSADQVALERRLESARKALSDAEQAAAWGQGCAMTMEQAIDYALARA